jgi:N-acetyl-anhydromuramyl-L-alanine amidase AmpD
MTLSIISHPAASDSYNDRSAGTMIEGIVIHSSEGDLAAALWLIDNPDPLALDRISWHYTVASDGSVYQHIADEKRAWHAGGTFYNGREDWDNFAIGIALVNHEGEPYTDAQYQALGELVELLAQTHPINPRFVAGRETIAIPRGSRRDPGALFCWMRLYQAVPRLWPTVPAAGPLPV